METQQSSPAETQSRPILDAAELARTTIVRMEATNRFLDGAAPAVQQMIEQTEMDTGTYSDYQSTVARLRRGHIDATVELRASKVDMDTKQHALHGLWFEMGETENLLAAKEAKVAYAKEQLPDASLASDDATAEELKVKTELDAYDSVDITMIDSGEFLYNNLRELYLQKIEASGAAETIVTQLRQEMHQGRTSINEYKAKIKRIAHDFELLATGLANARATWEARVLAYNEVDTELRGYTYEKHMKRVQDREQAQNPASLHIVENVA
jgi:hypothetical protein